LYASLKAFVKRALTRQVVESGSESRRVRIQEEEPSDRFVLVVGLMIVFFLGLLGLELVHMLLLGTWNEVIFNGIMLVVGTIVGAIWGKTSQ